MGSKGPESWGKRQLLRRKASPIRLESATVHAAVAAMGQELEAWVTDAQRHLARIEPPTEDGGHGWEGHANAHAALRETLKRMIRAVRDLAAEAEADLEPDMEAETDLGALMHELLEEQKALLDGTAAKIGVGRLPVVPGDPALLRRILRNLLVHAIEHADTSAPRVGLVASDNGQAWTLAVHDNGPALGTDDADALFSADREGPHDRVSARAALGLSLAAHAVQRLGATIGAFDHPDGGCVVWLRIEKTGPHGQTEKYAELPQAAAGAPAWQQGPTAEQPLVETKNGSGGSDRDDAVETSDETAGADADDEPDEQATRTSTTG